MLKKFPFLLFIFCIAAATASAYTVVLKNGKMMNGTLISETEQSILFKDDAGVQYSLKKANLDLDKMKDANAPKMEAPPPMEAPATTKEAPKKKARVYTKEDVDSLRSKYPELSLGEPVENPEDFEGGVLKPSAYGKRIQQGAEAIGSNVAGLIELRDGVATAWEVAASTGKSPVEAVNAVLATEKAAATMKSVSDDLMVLGRWQESMSNPPDKFKEGYDLYVQALTALSDFQKGIRDWNKVENVDLFRSNLAQLESQITTSIAKIPPTMEKPQTPPEKNPDQEKPEDQQPPNQ